MSHSTSSTLVNWTRNIGLILAILIATVSVQTAVSASHDATKAKNQAKAAKHEAQVTTYELKVAEYNRALADRKRAIGTCGSSTALRSLLNDVNGIIVGAAQDPTDPGVQSFGSRIHQFTDTNPNCVNIPPVPVKPIPPKGVNLDD